MSWNVYLVRMMTGEVGAKLEPENFSWNIPLNAVESGTLDVPKDQLAPIDRLWWTPDWGGVLITRILPDGEEIPWVAGPFVRQPKETRHSMRFSWEGIGSFFDGRVIDQTYNFQNLSLGTIMWRLVSSAMNKQGGKLPIVHGSPSESGSHSFKYEGWNLANNRLDKLLKKLCEMENGPDYMFRPEWTSSSHTAIRWSFAHGTNAAPTLSQRVVPDWDPEAEDSDVVDISIANESADIVDKVWYTGAGKGNQTTRISAFSDYRIVRGYPLRERVFSEPDETNGVKLYNRAMGYIKANGRPVDQVSMKVRADSERNPLGVWRVGDEARVTMEGWSNIPNGVIPMRIIRATGDYYNDVTLEFQGDRW